jgi:hypothetical protein
MLFDLIMVHFVCHPRTRDCVETRVLWTKPEGHICFLSCGFVIYTGKSDSRDKGNLAECIYEISLEVLL